MRENDKSSFMAAEVPEPLQPIFQKAQSYVASHFETMEMNPQKGTIDISGDRYILVRAASMSKEFFELITSYYQDRGTKEARSIASSFLFDIAHSLGKADARRFSSKMDLTEPTEKLSAGPIHFAYTGWAFVKIFAESRPSPDENYYIIYDHPYSFEADAWKTQGIKTDFPVCTMNAGYSSGWCEESFGISLVAVEVECTAMGHDHCRFIMAPPSKIEIYIQQYSDLKKTRQRTFEHIKVPEYFQRKRMEDELLKSEETSRALLNAITDRALLLDVEGNILSLNQKAAENIGKSISELIGINAFQQFENKIAAHRKKYHDQVVQTGNPIRYQDIRDERYLDTHLFPIRNSRGKVVRIAIFSRDITDLKLNEKELKKHRFHLEELVKERTAKLQEEITERKRIEEALKMSLKEKEVLLKEIHHRVKNNLQVISSLLSLQSTHIKDEFALNQFKISQNRVRSMALIHEKLYQSENLSRIDAKEYINSLVQGLLQAYGRDTHLMTLNIEVDKTSLPIDMAVPCGLIINELVSNVLKYAFPPDYSLEPRLDVVLKKSHKNHVELIVQDNGIGIPDNLDIDKSDSLGLKLVHILVQDQLEGEISMDLRKGTKFIIQFNMVKENNHHKD